MLYRLYGQSMRRHVIGQSDETLCYRPYGQSDEMVVVSLRCLKYPVACRWNNNNN